MQRMTKKTRNWSIISGIIIIVGGGIAYGIMNKKPTIEYTTADVSKGTLVQTVTETGTITPAKEIELNFLNSGQLSKMNVKVGDQVLPDQPLAQIDFSYLSIRQQEAEASLRVSQANVTQAIANAQSAQREYTRLAATLKEAVNQSQKTLRDLEDTSASTVTTYEQAITSAKESLRTSTVTYQRGIDNKVSSLGQTVENKLAVATTALDNINRILSDNNAKPTLGAQNSGQLSQTRTAYADGRSLLQQANADFQTYKRNAAYLDNAYDSVQRTLAKTFDGLNLMYSVLENTLTSPTFTQAQLDAYKSMIDGQLTSVSASVVALQTAQQSVTDARLALDTNTLNGQQSINQAIANYDNAVRTARNAVSTATLNRDQQLASAQTRVDSTQANVAVVSAQVGQTQANVNLIRDQIADTILKSPIKGIITKVNYQVGEQVTPGKALVSVLTENNFQLEIDIAETDISKVKLNDEAAVTLDSLGKSVVFNGKVYFIEPAATIIQGVTYYKVKISFDPGTQIIKPGMTAEAVITTARLEAVLMMPSRAVVERDNAKYVRILENGAPRETPVSVGLSGDNGMVEVLSGVNEGDKVVTFVKDSSKK